MAVNWTLLEDARNFTASNDWNVVLNQVDIALQTASACHVEAAPSPTDCVVRVFMFFF